MKLTREKTLSPSTEPRSISTTSFGKLRGFTLEVLDLLAKANLSSQEVSWKTDKSVVYVNVYLFRLQKYGLATKHDGFWFLTQKGVEIHSFLKEFIHSFNNNNTTITRKQHNNNTSLRKKPFQVSIQAWLRESSPGDAEKAVVDMLVKHFNDTGSKFILVKDHYAMSDMLSINVNDVGDVVARLRQDNIVYLMRDPTSGCWKLGLKKAFVEALQRDRLK